MDNIYHKDTFCKQIIVTGAEEPVTLSALVDQDFFFGGTFSTSSKSHPPILYFFLAWLTAPCLERAMIGHQWFGGGTDPNSLGIKMKRIFVASSPDTIKTSKQSQTKNPLSGIL